MVSLQLAITLGAWTVCAPSALVNDGFEIVSITDVTTTGENVKPFVIARRGAGAYLAWAQRVDGRTAVYFARSTDGDHFDRPTRMTPDGMELDLGAESGPTVAVGPNGTIYVVWAGGSPPPNSPSKKAIATPDTADRPAGHDGHAGHTKAGMRPRPTNLNIYLSSSIDDGRTFSKPIRINDDADGPEHRFPTVAVDSQRRVLIAWLDKRKSSEERPNFCRVYTAVSTDGGRTFAGNVDATDGQKGSICHCCRIALAVHSQNGAFIAFRNDIEDLRDMFLVHAKHGESSFSPPVAMEETGWYVPT